MTTIAAEQNWISKDRRVDVRSKNTGHKAAIEHGEGALRMAQRPGQAGHHSRFNPQNKPAGKLAQTGELYSRRARPGQTASRTARRPLTQTTPRWFFTQRRSTHRVIKRSATQETTPKRVFTTSPFPNNPFLTDSRNPLPHSPSNPFPRSPSDPFTRNPSNPFLSGPSNPFLSGNIDLPVIEVQPSSPVTVQPRPNTALPQVSTGPPGGPARGLMLATCPESADVLLCVKEQLCDLNTGYLISDGHRLSSSFPEDKPAVGMVQCLVDRGRLDVCCRRPHRLSTSTPLSLGTDSLEGLSTPRPRHQPQKPSSIFFSSYE